MRHHCILPARMVRIAGRLTRPRGATRVFLLAGCVVLGLAATGRAQVMGPSLPVGNAPAVSPYLNMIDNGFNTSGVSNYSILVQPLIEQREATQQQAFAIQQLQRSASRAYGTSRSSGSTAIRSTGHTTRFQNTSHYYGQQKQVAR